MRKWDEGRYRYFVGASDFHDKTDASNKSQLRDLKKILSRCATENLNVGLEDIGSPGVDRPASCGRFFVSSQGGILSEFSKLCESINLNFTNFEYRFCRVAALGPVLNNIEADLNASASVRATHVADLIKEVETIFHELLSYNDSALLKDLYAYCIKKVKRVIDELQLYQHAHQNVSDFLAQTTTQKNRLEMVKKLLTFDSILLDLRFLHNVVSSQSAPNYFMLAGGSHVNRVAKFLAKFGYEYVRTAEPRFVNEYKLEKCLGSHIAEGGYCKRPKPIKIDLLSDFL